MKLSPQQMNRLVQSVFDIWKEKKVVTFKDKEEKIFHRAVELINQEFLKEKDIEIEANIMVDKLEAQQPGLERHKLFLGIKKRLAKEKGVIL